MPHKTFVAGEEALAADVNLYLMGQAVARFPDAGARAAAIAAPVPGMVSYLTDTGRLEQYTDKSTPAGWHLPWGLPWGRMASAVVPDIGAIGGGIQFVPASTVTLGPAGRRQMYTLTGYVQKDATTGNVTLTATPGAGVRRRRQFLLGRHPFRFVRPP